MKKLNGLAFTLILLLASTFPIFADAGSPGAACGAVGCVFVVYLVILVAVLAGAIALIVFIFKWIKKDAKSRGMPNADTICWLALLGLLGLLIYVLTRPQGNTFPCQSCGMMRMNGLPQCPHCHQP